MTPVAPVPGLEPAFTVDARLSCLERSIFVASAVRGADSVTYTAYRVT